jgi:hypothetical protein
MKRLLLIGFAACTFALAPILSASAMPVAHPNTLAERLDLEAALRPLTGHHLFKDIRLTWD